MSAVILEPNQSPKPTIEVENKFLLKKSAAATRKPAFTASMEGDVFYDCVKRQFMSTVISADECLRKVLLSLVALHDWGHM